MKGDTAIDNPTDKPSTQKPLSRRALLKLALTSGVASSVYVMMPKAYAQDGIGSGSSEGSGPAEGDVLVYARGDNQGQPVTLESLPKGDAAKDIQAIWAYPKPADGPAKEGKNNTVVFARIVPDQLPDNMKSYVAEDVMALSAVCTHFQCLVERINAEGDIACGCHGSVFEVETGGEPIAGPAEYPLAILPIKVQDGQLVVADSFVGEVGGPGPMG